MTPAQHGVAESTSSLICTGPPQRYGGTSMSGRVFRSRQETRDLASENVMKRLTNSLLSV